jgi:uncharacterized membrane protein
MKPKNIALIAHFPFIGWIVSIILYYQQDNKNAFASFYLRQTLGIYLFNLAVDIVLVGIFKMGFLVTPIQLTVFVAVVYSFIKCINDSEEPLPLLGEKFQEWFKNL